MLTHVVVMKFTDPADSAEAKVRLESLVGVVPAIKSLRVGLDVVGSEASYHLCLTTTHDDLDGLRAYQAHPDHLEVATWLKPRLAARAVVDF